jgi:hypothetical protein
MLHDATKTKTPAVPPPADTQHARRNAAPNAQSNVEATRTDYRVRSRSKRAPSKRDGHSKKPTTTKKNETNTYKLYAQAARCNQNQNARRAAARRHTPRPPRHAAPNAAMHETTGK